AYLAQAVQTYDEIDGYGDSNSNREESEEHIEAIDARLKPGRPATAEGFWQRFGRALVHELAKAPSKGEE
ncbi:MAG TPA: hypothetical protein VMM92_12500, partial [Thermoanaerobaculia bacterium]|nr:hypothetical protein [Thermoanaerobaculia bacterium]